MGWRWMKLHSIVTRRHKRAPMSGNSKHSKNNLKIYVKNCVKYFFGGGCRDNIVFFYVQLINHHIYILNYAVI